MAAAVTRAPSGVLSPSPLRDGADPAAPAAASGQIYFTPDQFSARFGEQFFTAELIDRRTAAADAFVEYVVRCRCGRGAWTVAHRFREWAQLHRALARDGLKQPLPPKTCLRRTDEPFLEGRSEALATYLAEVCEFYNRSERDAARAAVRAFLLLDDQRHSADS